jgi:serine/threonine-protein kinase RsbW
MKKTFRRDFAALGEVFEFADRFISDHAIDESLRNWIKLAIEELFTNMVRHNEGGGEGIEIRINVQDGRLEIQLIDEDVDRFDPSAVPEVRLDAQIEERRAGGLGLHLVKAIVDEITYDYENRRMTVTIVKELER